VAFEKGGPVAPPVQLPKDLNRLVVADLKQRNTAMEKLARNLDKTYVPPPGVPPVKKADSVLFLGTGNDQGEADKLMAKHYQNPVTGKPYERILAFGQGSGAAKDFAKDLPRVVADHIGAEKAMLSKETISKVGPLKGAEIDKLVAHSNGATVAEAMIRADYIKVKDWHIMGGDRTLWNLDGLNQLAKDKNMDITVYVNRGDIVPLLPTLAKAKSAIKDPEGTEARLWKELHQIRADGRVKLVVFDKGPYIHGYDTAHDLLQKDLFHYLDSYQYNVRKYYQRP